MIINVRSYPNPISIIVSYLVENEEKTGYASFCAKKFLIKNKTDILAMIKKILTSSHKLSEMTVTNFVSTIDKFSRKLIYDTSLKQIVKIINNENTMPTTMSLSHLLFNGKSLPRIKKINIINNDAYFVIKMGADYNLELIRKEKIKCVMNKNGFIALYKQIKQGKKKLFKKVPTFDFHEYNLDDLVISPPTVTQSEPPTRVEITRENWNEILPTAHEREIVTEEPTREEEVVPIPGSIPSPMRVHPNLSEIERRVRVTDTLNENVSVDMEPIWERPVYTISTGTTNN